MKPFWRNLLCITAAVVVMNIVAPLALALLPSSSTPPEYIVFTGYLIAVIASALTYLLVLKLVPLKPKPVG